ncbi:phosphorylase b kinase gamma catalytic chain, skeletal muscle/heart isoform-like isoform X1 [Penaeus japonicus]|uniref:phosphorylase b kinase gamma catalytic chain, skeletal muscle/heart isoform-like isoform X1 n=1 Tax=Penaeus japonicus TaxID=27405 RepID=UPI001C70E4A3|nr:phosphorylase b kinase gamma catalytic chain, skeletal muscle/heart isoform-like isoform X1 [Penaeus japonicus]XP_042871553.1 phosphorylase b kinase gamma catalytic chain, skeletal muscle/heart isoform-like isoform X1 [Penaeus japonicus]XP_042871561.1 phosphorylase b kinase gamma catalytic chain, skeletal muscle/heart isoform-like isoform X1 [Penaeus japonicus]
MKMAVDDDGDVLPDRDAAKGFYAKYEPKEVLGRGGCSVVRRCIEKETGQQFAAKIIDLSDSTTEGVYEATMREVEVLRLVAGHPYIIEMHDVFESSTFIFLVFELCEHGELFDHLTTVVTLSEKKTKVIMRQLLEALAHVHGKGIVHRDLKPENILLDDNYNIKLTDFGFAKVLAPSETLTELCGTPGYLAPELLRCNMIEGSPGYGHPVDLWACGVIMYTLLVGCPPFWHRKQMVMIRNIMEGKYSFQSPEWDDITDAPKDLISKLLVVDPSKRINVQEALAHDFFQIMPSRSQIIGVTQVEKQYKGRPFNAKKMFQFGIMCVRAVIRIQRLRFTPEPVSLAVTRVDPYKVKALRKVIDNCAFRVYGHWVKKGEGQDRAALFQNYPKLDFPRGPMDVPLIVGQS